MKSEAMRVYLDDHLAGATTALELIDEYREKRREADQKQFLEHLLGEIREDRDLLASLRERLEGGPSLAKQAAGWMAEKASRLKLKADAGADADLGWFEALDLLAIGILGKRGLWAALRAVHADWFSDVDFDELHRRAQDQFSQVEAQRLAEARRLFAANQDG